MRSKVNPSSGRNFGKGKYAPLTPKMIDALLEAIEKQKNKIPFGPSNIKGSLGVLISKGLIIREKITIEEQSESQWQVADEAITLLKELGINV